MSKTFIIYKIRPLDKTIYLSYIGSTICFAKRKSKHKGVYCNEKSKSHDVPLYKFIRENGGWDAFEMVPLEEYKCDTKLQARIREQDTLDKIENKLNSIRAYSDDTTTKEQKKLYRDENKERIQEHYLENRDDTLQKRKDYRNKNKTNYSIKCYIQECRKENPKNPVFLISPKYDDPTLKEVKKYIKQFELGDEFLNTEIGLEDLRNSLIVFDDAESLMDKRLKDKVFRLLNLVMTAGRSYGISVCVVSHAPTNGKETRLMLLENSHCQFFPNYLSDHNLNYLCKNYLGLGKGHIEKILKTNDRSCCVLNNPRVVVGDR
jgi:GTPase SAR1 family protein